MASGAAGNLARVVPLLVALLGCALPVVSAERLLTKAEEVVQWKRAALGATAALHTLSGHAVGATAAGAESRDLVKVRLASADFAASALPGNRVQDLAAAAIADKYPRGARKQKSRAIVRRLDTETKERFIKNALSTTSQDNLVLVKDSLGNLLDGRVCKIKCPTKVGWWRRRGFPADRGDKHSEYFAIKRKDGSRAAVVKRFLPGRGRSPKQVRALSNELRAMRKLRGPSFLRVPDRRGAKVDLSEDQDAPVIVLLEPFAGTMRQLFAQAPVPLSTSLYMLLNVMYGVDQMYRKGAVHTSVITPDTVLVKGETFGDPAEAESALCPSIFSTDLRLCTRRERLLEYFFGDPLPKDAVKKEHILEQDIQQCGELIKWALKSSKRDMKINLRPFEALAEAMESGLYAQLGGSRGAYWAFVYLAFQSARIADLERKLQEHTKGVSVEGYLAVVKLVKMRLMERHLSSAQRRLESLTSDLRDGAMAARKAPKETGAPLFMGDLRRPERPMPPSVGPSINIWPSATRAAEASGGIWDFLKDLKQGSRPRPPAVGVGASKKLMSSVRLEHLDRKRK